MVKGGMYIVSGAIFPSYFLKNEKVSYVMQKQAELDVKTFCQLCGAGNGHQETICWNRKTTAKLQVPTIWR